MKKLLIFILVSSVFAGHSKIVKLPEFEQDTITGQVSIYREPQVTRIFVPCPICHGDGFLWKSFRNSNTPPFKAPCTMCGGTIKYCGKETGYKYLSGRFITVK